MPTIDTANLVSDAHKNHELTYLDNQQIYCGLDSCVTLELRKTLEDQYGKPNIIYDFERAMQGPYLEIMQRGFRIDQLSRSRAAQELREKITQLTIILDEFSAAIWDRPLNPNSPKQLQEFFYARLHLPEQWINQKGERKLSMNREVMEKLDATYLFARPFTVLILEIRNLLKQLQVFETEIDADGRFRASYNIAGTETGRPSSSENAFGTGGNAQNIAPGLRYVFVADPGYKLCVIDLEQVEARDVGFFIGNLFGDWKFLDNCESGDLHTNNSKLVWSGLGWTGDSKADREIADKIFYREFTYRDMAKRGGHLCLTPDYEVLTPNGWVSITEKPHTIMTFSRTGSKFDLVQHWTDDSYSGDLISYEGNSISALMTPKHRVPFIRDTASWKNFYVQEAKEKLVGFLPLGWGYKGGEEIVPAKLIAAFMSDGHQKSVDVMEFNITKDRKVKRLKDLCFEYGYEFNQRPNGRIFVYGNLPKKCGAFMFNWTRECLKDFVDEYKHWDGHISPTAVALFSVDKKQLEWLQTFGRILGIGGQIKHSISKSNFGGGKNYVTDYYNLGQNNRRWATARCIKQKVVKEQTTRVYCPTVEDTFFYVRRNGKIFVTGNSNYYGTPPTMARALKIPVEVATEFQARYVRGGKFRDVNGKWHEVEPAFPGIARWWQWTAEQLQTKGVITTPFGRTRHFFGRPDDDTTLREAIAFLPQSTTADRMNLGLWRVWRYMPEVELLAQTYDSITFQFPMHLDEDQVINDALQHLKIELKANNGRSYVVPGEAKTGWNWGYYADENTKGASRLNLDGLKKWKSGTRDTRTRTTLLHRLG